MKTLLHYITEEKKKILYIHGLNSDKSSSTFKYLQTGFPEYDWYSETFDLKNPTSTIKRIENIIKNKNISTVVASSLGAFYGLYISDSVAKILINPCMHPSIEIPKLGEKVDVKEFEKLEQKTYTNIDRETRLGTFAVFSNQDELFSYKSEFLKLYGDNFIAVKGSHRLDQRTLLASVQYGFEHFKRINKILREGLINESYVNVVVKDSDKVSEYEQDVWNLLQASYAPIGGILGCDNIQMLKDDSDFWKLVRRSGEIVAVAIYTFKRGGRKLMYCGTDGTDIGKKELYKIVTDDAKLKDRSAWAEVSGKMEHIYMKQGATPVPAETAQLIMKDKPFVHIHSDGFHYDRMIGGELYTKILIGNPTK